MTIAAPLAVLGIAKTAFSIIGSLADAVSRPASQTAAAATPAKAQESIWHQLGQAVDVTALSRDEMTKVAWTLYDNGAIGLDDFRMLTLDHGDQSGLLTAADAQGRVDWAAEFQARLDQHRSQGDEQAMTQDQRALDILSRLRAGSKGVTSIRV
ncbi:MAG: hypothetical protein EOL86_08755 [Deltaproteobacteria bacterium]|nr:hypothetical protein [Deltaproteobacteria bacterium]